MRSVPRYVIKKAKAHMNGDPYSAFSLGVIYTSAAIGAGWFAYKGQRKNENELDRRARMKVQTAIGAGFGLIWRMVSNATYCAVEFATRKRQ